jgi:hypothetical protein
MGFMVLAGCAAIPAGCSMFESATPAPTEETRLPAFVYPSEPPVVGAEGLRGLIVRFDAPRTVLWIFDAPSACPRTAGLLAEHRDALRTRKIALAGVYTGDPSDWSARITPLLKEADANFLCAVLDPASHSAVGLWLSGRASAPPPGLYVLSQSRRAHRQADNNESSVRRYLERLTLDEQISTRPAEPHARHRAQARVVELASGRTLASAEAQADDPAGLIQLLALQLSAALPAPARVAILPLRQTGRADPEVPDAGLGLSDNLGRCLHAAGWQSIVPAHQVRETLGDLGQSRFSVEFAPSELAVQTNWNAILVGTFTVSPSWEQP